MNCSNCGFSFDSCRLKSSTVPILRMLIPGNLLLLLYIKLPQTEQKLSSIVAPDAIVLFWAHLVNLSSPRTCLRLLSLTVKFEQNMEALSLWQSLQLQTNVLSRSSPSTGYYQSKSVIYRATSYRDYLQTTTGQYHRGRLLSLSHLLWRQRRRPTEGEC